MFKVFMTNEKCKKKKLTGVYSSHLGYECIIWGTFYEKGGFYLLIPPKQMSVMFSILGREFVKLPIFFMLDFFVSVNIFNTESLFIQVCLVYAHIFITLVENFLNFGMCY